MSIVFPPSLPKCLQMIEQFQNLLESPRVSSEDALKRTQDLVLAALQNMFPPDYDFSQLAKMYEDPKVTSSQSTLTYHLVSYFVQLVGETFVSIHSYESLEAQTQKLQATIRSHIKLEQEVKMYLQHLENKIAKYERYLQQNLSLRSTLQQPLQISSETALLRQRLSLIKRNERLANKLREREEELKKLNRMNSSRLELVDNFIERDKLTGCRSERKVGHIHSEGESSKGNREESVLRKLRPPTEQNAITISITGNNNEVNYYSKK